MASYSIQFSPSVEKDLRRLPKTVASRVMAAIEALATEPFPRQSIKLSNAEGLYRVRVGSYRIVYEVDTPTGTIVVHYVRHRSDVYRSL